MSISHTNAAPGQSYQVYDHIVSSVQTIKTTEDAISSDKFIPGYYFLLFLIDESSVYTVRGGAIKYHVINFWFGVIKLGKKFEILATLDSPYGVRAALDRYEYSFYKTLAMVIT